MQPTLDADAHLQGVVAVENGCGATGLCVSLPAGNGGEQAMGEPPLTRPPSAPATELLASASNPNGLRLDALIAQIRTEFAWQLLALNGNDETIRPRLLGYQGVIAALWEAEGRYRALGHPQSRV